MVLYGQNQYIVGIILIIQKPNFFDVSRKVWKYSFRISFWKTRKKKLRDKIIFGKPYVKKLERTYALIWIQSIILSNKPEKKLSYRFTMIFVILVCKRNFAYTNSFYMFGKIYFLDFFSENHFLATNIKFC